MNLGISHIFSTSMILSFIYTSKRSPKPSRLGTPRPALTKDGGSLQPRPTLPSPNMAAPSDPPARCQGGSIASSVTSRTPSGGRRFGSDCSFKERRCAERGRTAIVKGGSGGGGGGSVISSRAAQLCGPRGSERPCEEAFSGGCNTASLRSATFSPHVFPTARLICALSRVLAEGRTFASLSVSQLPV